jgi:hypothetical protein
MRVLKSRIRGFFAFQAVLYSFGSIGSAIHPSKADVADPARHYAYVTIYFVLAVIFASAFATTRKASTFRNRWAVAASLVSLGAGACIVWLEHVKLAYATPGMLSIVLGVGALHFYGRGVAAAADKAKFENLPDSETHAPAM